MNWLDISNWIFIKVPVENWPDLTILTVFGFLFLVQKLSNYLQSIRCRNNSYVSLYVSPFSFLFLLPFAFVWVNLMPFGPCKKKNAFDVVPVQTVTFSRGMFLQIQLNFRRTKIHITSKTSHLRNRELLVSSITTRQWTYLCTFQFLEVLKLNTLLFWWRKINNIAFRKKKNTIASFVLSFSCAPYRKNTHRLNQSIVCLYRALIEEEISHCLKHLFLDYYLLF